MNIAQFVQSGNLDKIAEVMDLLPIPIFLLQLDENQEFRFVAVNSAYRAISGDEHNAYAGKLPHECFSGSEAEAMVANQIRCLDARSDHSYDEVINTSSGEVWLRTKLSPVFDGENISGIVGISTDQTGAKQNEWLLSENLNTAARINSDLRVTSSTIAHDVRTPMRQIGILIELLLQDFKDLGDQKVDLLNRSRAISVKAIEKINHMVAHVHRLNEKQVKTSTQIDFGKWCLDMVALFDPLKKVEFSYPSVELLCEPFILDVVLRNLLDNAYKHTKTFVSVDVVQRGSSLIFTVNDDGMGFAPEFFKKSETPVPLRSETRSSGHGLAVCVELIESRGGELWIDETAEAGKGGIISFRVSGKEVDASEKEYCVRVG